MAGDLKDALVDEVPLETSNSVSTVSARSDLGVEFGTLNAPEGVANLHSSQTAEPDNKTVGATCTANESLGWSASDEARFLAAVKKYGAIRWDKISSDIFNGSRSPQQLTDKWSQMKASVPWIEEPMVVSDTAGQQWTVSATEEMFVTKQQEFSQFVTEAPLLREESNGAKVEIDFASASSAWNANKSDLHNGMKVYIHPQVHRVPPEISTDAGSSASAAAPGTPSEEPDSTCPICLRQMDEVASTCEDVMEIAVLDSCNHRYCLFCISEWSKVTNTCPKCRQTFVAIDTFSYADSVQYLRQKRVVNSAVHVLQHIPVQSREQAPVDDSAWVFQEELDFANDGVECLSDRNECVVRMGNYGANGNHFSVQCDTCSRWFHGCCVGFSSEYDVPDIWHCSSCVRSSEEAVGALLSARNDIDLPQGSLRAMPALVEAREEIFDPSLSVSASPVEEGTIGMADTAPISSPTVSTSDEVGSEPLSNNCASPIGRKRKRPVAATIPRAPFEDFCKFQQDLCTACGGDSWGTGNEILFCDRCDLTVHQKCYGVHRVPKGKWYCDACKAGFETPPPCIFCPSPEIAGLQGGVMKRTTCGTKWAHVRCAYWIREATFIDPEKMGPIGSIDVHHRIGGIEGIPASIFGEMCDLCGSSEGACIQCTHTGCKFVFHPMCATQAFFYMAMEQTSGDIGVALVAFCKHHTATKRCDVFTGKDIDVWLSDLKKWSKARVGFVKKDPGGKTRHIIVYHADGIIEEMLNLRSLISASAKISDKPKVKQQAQGRPIVRLCDSWQPPPEASEQKPSEDIPKVRVCISEPFAYSMPEGKWKCRNCGSFNGVQQFICSLCCLDCRLYSKSMVDNDAGLARYVTPHSRSNSAPKFMKYRLA